MSKSRHVLYNFKYSNYNHITWFFKTEWKIEMNVHKLYNFLSQLYNHFTLFCFSLFQSRRNWNDEKYVWNELKSLQHTKAHTLLYEFKTVI